VYARSTTIQADVDSIDAGIAHVRDQVMPSIMRIDGCIGLSLLVNRESGRCIATSSWETAEAMRASADQVQPIRDRAAEIFGGTSQVEEWEIAAMHRDHPSHGGACVRVTWTQTEPDQIDRWLDAYQWSMPQIERLEGYCSTSILIDRASGRLVASATYDSRDALERSRERAAAVRTGGVEQARSRVLDVHEFELAIAHLRVPELV
jgi:heme-degrading monooxygenase HmoA